MKLLETIRIENGIAENTLLHIKRMQNAYNHVFSKKLPFDLVDVINNDIDKSDNGLKKCRVVYDEYNCNAEVLDYCIKPVNTLKLIEDNAIDYKYKFEDRTRINELFSKRGEADDIIIVKNGLITDSSYANLLFFNGNEWLTPSFPLLRGVQRQKLLADETIQTADIMLSDLAYFTKVRLINAMIRMEDCLDIDISSIYY